MKHYTIVSFWAQLDTGTGAEQSAVEFNSTLDRQWLNVIQFLLLKHKVGNLWVADFFCVSCVLRGGTDKNPLHWSVFGVNGKGTAIPIQAWTGP